MNLKNKTMEVNGGVIIIGSLLWQDSLICNNNDNIRKNWRLNNLGKDYELSKILVYLPIRYGRYSNNGLYTMVFSNDCSKNSKLGIGYVIPFITNPLHYFWEIECQARKMSKAEGMNGKFVGNTNNIWSTMGIIFNDSKISKPDKDYLLKQWSEKLKKDGGGNDADDYKIGQEESCITSDGELNINMPKIVYKRDQKRLNKLDFLIATSTKPKHENGKREYPDYKEIVESVKNDIVRHYFINNVKQNIRTFEDNEILVRLGKIKY